MSTRATVWLAWALWVVVMAFGATSLDLSEVSWFWYVLTHYLGRPEDIAEVLVSGILVLAVPAYATVGAVVASLRPKEWAQASLAVPLMLVRFHQRRGCSPSQARYIILASERSAYGRQKRPSGLA